MPKQIIKFLDDLSPSDLKLRDLPRKPDSLMNLSFNCYGQLVKRAGYSKYNIDSIATDPPDPEHKIVGLHRSYKRNTAEKEFIVAWNQGLYKLPDTGEHTPAPLTGCPTLRANADTYFADFADHCYIVNGVNSMMKYDMTYVRINGIAVPIAPTDNSRVTGGLSAGVYHFCYTFVDEDGYEGNGGAESEPITVEAAEDKGIKIDIATGIVTFIGDGLNDAIFTGNVTTSYKIEIDEEGTPDTFKWTDDGGGNWTEDVDITGSAQNLSNGVTITFAATTGHTTGDYWTLTVDPKIAKRRIYRTTVGGSIYYYNGVVEDNETPTYDSIMSDEEISLKSVLHIDHNAPPAAPDLVVKRLSRINIAVDDDLYVSKNYDKTTGARSVEYFPPYNYFPTGNGQNITGLIEQLGGLPVFTENTIERLVGTDEDNFELRNAHQEDGCIAKRSVVNCKNYVVYLAFNGIYIFDGVSARAIDVAFGGRLNKYIRENINYSKANLSCATYYDNKYLLCIPTGESAVPNVTIYFDFSTGKYGVYSFAFSCFSKWDKGGDGLSLKGGSNTIGRVYEIGGTILTDYNESTEEDDDITAYDEIEPIDFGRPEVYKQFYSIFIKIKSTGGEAFKFYYKLDDDADWTLVSKTITKDTTKWYRVGLGSGGKRARALQPKPYMSDKFYFEIHGLAICYDEEAFAEEKD
ncbi:hypothetical protein ES695_02140 [Candidatus Atribacteria bacterium 1244-E10-H5-B2]|nr:MAG: hypothetical protein ES695_02140 [Candidatus Atribacteria bacterium 1244-E10-H5-B2]